MSANEAVIRPIKTKELNIMTDNNQEEFIGQAIVPVAGTGDAVAMSRGEPGVPGVFSWRDTEYRVVQIVSQWKTSGPCKSGSKEMYLRRHWYKIITAPAMVMTIYCDRQGKNPKRPKQRWWLYTIEPVGTDIDSK